MSRQQNGLVDPTEVPLPIGLFRVMIIKSDMYIETKKVWICGNERFINDVMLLGWKGSHFCDTMYEVLIKTGNLVRQRGEGVKKSPNWCDVINGWPP